MKAILTSAVALCCLGCSQPEHDVVTVVLRGSERFVLHGDAESTKVLQEDLQREYNSRGESPVLIRASSQTTHLSVRKAVDICSALGFWQITLADDSGTPLRVARLWTFDPSQDQMWIPTNAVRVDLTSAGYDHDSLTGIGSKAPVLLACSRHSTYGLLVDVIKHCESVGNTNVYIISMAGDNKAELDEPAHQQQ